MGIAIALAILIHLATFWLKLDWIFPRSSAPIEVHTVDPQKLEAIRDSWKNSKNRPDKLLLNPNPSQTKPKEAPPEDARYFSDQNIRARKEQRAKDHSVLPKPGPQGPEGPKGENAPSKPAPPLRSLGVPLPAATGDSVPLAKPKESSPPRPEGGGGAQQFIDDKNLPTGAENVLNAQESVFYSFYARLYEAVAPIWRSRAHSAVQSQRIQPGEYSTLIEVVLDERGNLVEVRQIQSSGIPAFDRAAEESWHRIGRFPNPPRDLQDANGLVRTGWTFTIYLGGGPGIQLLPPERAY